MFNDDFDSFDTSFWYVSDFTVSATWNQTSWEADYVEATLGEVTLNLDGADQNGKPFTGSEIQSRAFYGYGSYEVTMQAAAGSGAVSSFFLFTSEFFDAQRHNEIDFEFLGDDTTKVNINYYYGNEKLGDNGSVQIPLGFDAAAGMHTYRIDWQPDAIRWFADSTLIYEVRAETAPLPIPDEAMKVYMNLWTGDSVLEHWHGPAAANLDTQAVYSSVSYDPGGPYTQIDQTGAVDFSDGDDALLINMQDGTYAKAAKVLPLGDSLTLGIIDVLDPNEVPEDRDGYRMDLFDMIVAGGGWVDYVGGLNTGPAEMMDTDHAGIGGEPLWRMVLNNSASGEADISDALAAHTPDIMLLMAGTNDFSKDASKFFSNRFPKYIQSVTKAVDQFYEQPGNESKHLVISTLAPWTAGTVTPIYSQYVNEGYSTVNGSPVVGDAGNGTYVPGLKALITGLQANHPTLHLFENPVTEADLSPDAVHWTTQGFNTYASALYSFLQSEIGDLTGGPEELLGALNNAVTGSAAGDRIIGSDADDVIDGDGGADLLEGGAGADVFRYTTAALDGSRDVIADFSVAQNDVINLGAIAAAFGWSLAQAQAALAITDTAQGAELTLTTPGGTFTFALVQGITAAALTSQIEYENRNSADDDQNMALSAPDLFIDLTEKTNVEIVLSGLDADATAVISISDGTTTLTQNVSTNGAVFFDVSGLADGELVTRVTATDAQGATLILTGPSLSLSSLPPSPSADDDENMALAAPDLLIEAGEESAVEIVLSGLDADATAVISISDGTTTLTQNAAVDGAVFFDLSTLSDGALTTSVTATDVNGYTTTLAGPALTLDAAPDTSADEDGNLALSAPDVAIDASEAGNVVLNVSGIDADATATVSITDGVNTLNSAILAADGAVNFDISGFNDGAISTSVTVTDTSANTLTLPGPALTLDTSSTPPPPPPSDVIEGTSSGETLNAPSDASFTILGYGGRDKINGAGGNDTLEGGADVDRINGGAGADVFRYGMDALDGNRDRIYDFSIAQGDRLDLSQITAHYGWSAAQLLAAFVMGDTSAGLKVGLNTPDGGFYFATLTGITTADFDPARDIIAVLGSADDDANMALAVPDTLIEFGEQGAVEIVLSGLDADATAVISISDGTTTLTQNAAVDGAVFFDLSTLSDGALTTSVTATDVNGYTTTLAGPALTLDAAPDTSADEDGNLALSAPDLLITSDEAGTVTIAVSGIDADASAVVSVSDGVTTVSSPPLATDGSISLDLSTLTDGPLTTSVTATDGTGNTATVAGPALTLDTTISDTSADEDANLALSAPDLEIDAAESGAVTLSVAGIDADATAVVSISDGVTTLSSGVLGGDGSAVFDISGLNDGALTTSVTATDDAGNTATIAGPALSYDSTVTTPANVLTGTEGDDKLTDTNFDFLIQGLGGNDTLIGRGGSDTLLGGEGNDNLRADEGNDIVDGGAGRDNLRGGTGADTFIFNTDGLDGQTDRLLDFSAADGDLLDLSGIATNYGWSALDAQGNVSFTQTSKGVDVYLNTPDQGNLRLVDVRDITLADISYDDFIFV